MAQSFDEVEGLASEEGMVVTDNTVETPTETTTATTTTTAETTSSGPELLPWLLGAVAAGGLVTVSRRVRRARL